VAPALSGFAALPPHAWAGMAIVILFAIQAEVRFGKEARGRRPGSSDRGSSRAVYLATLVPIFGFTLAMKAWTPAWFRAAALPGMPAIAWAGAVVGFAGLATRLWAVLTLRERFTRTLLTQENQAIERGGPYRFARHPGYLGSLLALNGVALTSGNAIVVVASLVATGLAYAYRIRTEDAMLVAAFGEPYERYRREVGALLPLRHRTRRLHADDHAHLGGGRT
jgi:protein-S-isoprenylcysteine O-methyltransferase Ste14